MNYLPEIEKMITQHKIVINKALESNDFFLAKQMLESLISLTKPQRQLKVCKLHKRELTDGNYCRDHNRVLKKGEYN